MNLQKLSQIQPFSRWIYHRSGTRCWKCRGAFDPPLLVDDPREHYKYTLDFLAGLPLPKHAVYHRACSGCDTHALTCGGCGGMGMPSYGVRRCTLPGDYFCVPCGSTLSLPYRPQPNPGCMW